MRVVNRNSVNKIILWSYKGRNNRVGNGRIMNKVLARYDGIVPGSFGVGTPDRQLSRGKIYLFFFKFPKIFVGCIGRDDQAGWGLTEKYIRVPADGFIRDPGSIKLQKLTVPGEA